MNISKKVFLFFAILFLLTATLSFYLWSMADTSNRLTETQKRRFDSYKLAEELRRSSDQLTRMARSYVATGDERFKEYFEIIADIRDGKKARPENYDETFWDYVTEEFDFEKFSSTPDRKISLLSMMEELHFTDDELSLLAEAKLYSDNLINLEVQAFHAMEGLFLGDDNQYSIQSEPDPELASQLLYGTEYHQEKARIMRKVDDFFHALEKRTTSEINDLQEEQRRHQIIVASLAIVIVIYILLGFHYFRADFVIPLKKIKQDVLHMQSGNYIFQDVQRKDEIGLLMQAFKEMADIVSKNIEKLNKTSRTDALTKLNNRRTMNEALELEKYNTTRYRTESSIIMIDIDHFKKVNDQHGHNIGDLVLQEFANILQKRTRSSDVVCRWGGEEFLVLCSNTSYENTQKAAESLRKAINNYLFTEVGHITASFGVADIGANKSLEDTVSQADSALYKAKKSGKNRVC
ncbi:MAG: sensor domain-containing diguanylate cyclase [Chloroflexi bacterium]|nr:sensor domain-containing diguanylate cyclase [Chloroflexota bacterium]